LVEKKTILLVFFQNEILHPLPAYYFELENKSLRNHNGSFPVLAFKFFRFSLLKKLNLKNQKLLNLLFELL